SYHAGNDCRIDAEHFAIKLENKVVELAAQHHVAEIDVVERQEEPAPEQGQRRYPHRQQIAHQNAFPAVVPVRLEKRTSVELTAAALAIALAGDGILPVKA